MRVAIYARVSTKDKGQDVENQMSQLRQFADAMKWTVTEVYTDHVTASGKKDRSEFTRMFADASKRKFDLVLFWALDRFSREGVRETLVHLTRLDSYGVGFRSFSEQYLDSTGIFKDAVIAILAAIAKQERIRISERTRAGLDRVRAAGRKLGKPPVFIDTLRLSQLRNAGLSVRQIADEMGLKRSTAGNAVKALSQAG